MSIISAIGSFLLKAFAIILGICGIVIFSSIIIEWVLVEVEKQDNKLTDDLKEADIEAWRSNEIN